MRTRFYVSTLVIKSNTSGFPCLRQRALVLHDGGGDSGQKQRCAKHLVHNVQTLKLNLKCMAADLGERARPEAAVCSASGT